MQEKCVIFSQKFTQCCKLLKSQRITFVPEIPDSSTAENVLLAGILSQYRVTGLEQPLTSHLKQSCALDCVRCMSVIAEQRLSNLLIKICSDGDSSLSSGSWFQRLWFEMALSGFWLSDLTPWCDRCAGRIQRTDCFLLLCNSFFYLRLSCPLILFSTGFILFNLF